MAFQNGLRFVGNGNGLNAAQSYRTAFNETVTDLSKLPHTFAYVNYSAEVPEKVFDGNLRKNGFVDNNGNTYNNTDHHSQENDNGYGGKHGMKGDDRPYHDGRDVFNHASGGQGHDQGHGGYGSHDNDNSGCNGNGDCGTDNMPPVVCGPVHETPPAHCEPCEPVTPPPVVCEPCGPTTGTPHDGGWDHYTPLPPVVIGDGGSHGCTTCEPTTPHMPEPCEPTTPPVMCEPKPPVVCEPCMPTTPPPVVCEPCVPTPPVACEPCAPVPPPPVACYTPEPAWSYAYASASANASSGMVSANASSYASSSSWTTAFAVASASAAVHGGNDYGNSHHGDDWSSWGSNNDSSNMPSWGSNWNSGSSYAGASVSAVAVTGTHLDLSNIIDYGHNNLDPLLSGFGTPSNQNYSGYSVGGQHDGMSSSSLSVFAAASAESHVSITQDVHMAA